MLRHKKIDRVCCIVLALTLLLSILFVGAAESGLITEDTVIGYETRLFDQSRVHTIDIVMQDWEDFLDTATSEEYAACHLVIDGESFKNVAIRGKGNTSLSSVQAYGNDRYSFKVEFDHYQSGVTYHGLDKLSLNNLIQDNTYMKDYFAYTMMNQMGVAAPLCSFVQINVNGEPWGLYLAVEGVEDAFLQRNYGKDHGELYKPDSMSFGGGRGNGRDFDMAELAERFGFSFSDDGGQQTFAPAEGAGMPAAPEGFDPSWMGSFGGSSGQSAATAAPTAHPEPTATPAPEAAPSAPEGSFGASSGDAASAGESASSGDAASSGMPANGEMPDLPANGDTPGGLDPSLAPGSRGESADAPDTATLSPVMPEVSMAPEAPEMPEGFTPPDWGGNSDMPGGFGGMGSSDVKLQYTDDDPSSYPNIFDNAKTEITAADQARLIAAIKALNEGDLSAVDAEAVIRYMVVHNFLCNDDSYTGTIIHNYYLYEEDGVLAMIPWDYNLAYGGHSMGLGSSDAASVVNRSIDTLVSNGGGDRPMADWITNDSGAMSQYHAVYAEFIATVFDSRWFAGEIARVTAMIDPFVRNDPTAFCTYEEFHTGAETLRQFCLKRAQSIAHQLSGEDARVDASELTLSAMGTMGSMGGRGGIRGGFERTERKNGGEGRARSTATPAPGSADEMPSFAMPSAAPDASLDSSGSSSGRSASGAATMPEASAEPTASEVPDASDARVRPDLGGGFDVTNMSLGGSASQGWSWVAACTVLLAAALVSVGFFRTNR